MAEEYLMIRRGLGFKLTSFGNLLAGFADRLDQSGAATITTQACVDWATDTIRSTNPVTWSRRMLVARLFARYMKAFDPATEIPPPDVLNHFKARRVPYLYTHDDVTALMGLAHRHVAGSMYVTLIGLAWCSGLRLGELLRLDDTDIDWDNQLIHVKGTKFGKSRDVPLHPSTMAALASYQHERNRLLPNRAEASLFTNTRGRRPAMASVGGVFRKLVTQAGLPLTCDGHPARFHDLRHSAATQTLIQCYRDGADPEQVIAALSVYLGHVDPRSTYWYLTGSPELMSLAAQRLDRIAVDGGDDND